MRGETAGERLLRNFCNAVSRGETPDKAILVSMADSFRRIRRGEDPKKALDIERTRGRKKPISARETLPYVSIVCAVLRLRQRDGMTYEDAVGKVAADNAISYKTAQRYYKQYKTRALTHLKMVEGIDRQIADLQATMQKISALSTPSKTPNKRKLRDKK